MQRGSPRRRPLRTLVLGDLVLDVVLVPSVEIESATDVPGRVEIRQGGSAANVARWLARLGVRSQLVCAIGRDGAGRSLVAQLERDGVTVRAIRVTGQRTGRIGVVVAPGGERSFVQDRRAALHLRPQDLKADWFDRLDLLHLPVYSLLGEPLGLAGLRAVELARARGALVSTDLASVGPLLAGGRRAARELIARIAADLIFATEREAEALLGRYDADRLMEFAPLVVIKRGSRGARVVARDGSNATGTGADAGLGGGAETGSAEEAIAESPPLRFDVATTPVPAVDTTGAGDAFDAGFIAGWLESRAAGTGAAAALHRATVAGHRVAARQLRAPRPELPPG
ncbi:MAG TPA: PfkB family carbohydrate kinase [Candidatus Deferrimicrobiaceae bacterium]|nr:PfkB family carbohydrate kinase [Candidatus Deferrimicrobiaceae bacterium]